MEEILVFDAKDIYRNEPPLEVDCYGSTSIFGVIANTTFIHNSTTINATI
jgi:hypothetical protein